MYRISTEKVGGFTMSSSILAKSLYSRLFDYIVMRINQSIPFQSSNYYIGITFTHSSKIHLKLSKYSLIFQLFSF